MHYYSESDIPSYIYLVVMWLHHLVIIVTPSLRNVVHRLSYNLNIY